MSRLDELMARYGGVTQPQTNRVGTALPSLPSGPTSRLDTLMQRYGGAPQVQELSNPADGLNELPTGVRAAAGGALRGLASSLEPLQFAQDTMFAALAGAVDPNTTISQRLSTIEFAKYAPWGEAPARPANGEEIFKLLGFDDTFSKWAGIAADLTVDPLVFGSWLRVAGKVTAIQDLVKMGDKVDNFISPIGFGREVTRFARKSERISDFMDTRTEAFMQVLRNPDSTLFGIQRFGLKATDKLRPFLTQGQFDVLRFGRDTADALGDARRSAATIGKQVPEDALNMLYRARFGVQGDPANDMFRTFISAQEDQVNAWNRTLSGMDPTIRDLIEREVYNVIRPKEGKPGIGFLAFVGSREGIETIADPITRTAAREAYDALTSQRGIGTSKAAPSTDFLFQGVQESTHKKILDEATDHIGTIARERAASAGLAGQELANAERRAIDTFKTYLGDTLAIDAKLGVSMSGMPFIGNQVRTRAFEITGSLDEAGQVWNRILHTGLLRGKAGIEELKGAETRISLRNLVKRGSVDTTVKRTQDYRERLAAEIVVLGGRDRPRMRADTALAKNAEIYERAKRLYINPEGTGNFQRVDVPAALFPNREKAMAHQAAVAGRETAEGALREAEKALESARKFGASSITEGENVARLAPHVAAVHRAENALQFAMQKEIAVLNDIERLHSVSGGTRMVRTPMGMDAKTQAKRQTIFKDLLRQATEAKRALTDSQYARSRMIDDVVEARRRAGAAAGVGPAGAATREGAKAAEDVSTQVTAVLRDMDPIPLAGRNATAEDILARRLDGGMTLEQAVAKNITFGEILDGAADMQALPIGDFLSGIMNGHMRRAYALFQDTDDFRRYIDNLVVGTIVPSRIIDDSRLTETMTGFEREAELIVQYRNLMDRAGKGGILKRTGIAEYLLGSGVDPDRVNGALAAMMRALGPENGNLGRFVDHMNAMVPTYRKQIAAREERIMNIDPRQPRIADKRFFEDVEQMPKEMLEQLGEIAMASASVFESAGVAQRVVKRQEMFQNIYQTAKAKGLLKNAEYTDEFGTRYVRYADGEAVMGGFGGKWVHPYLYEELRRAATIKKENVNVAFNRMRALITGGYLAAPSVIAANFFGGLYQAATVGINPAVMFRNLVEVVGDVNRASTGRRSALVEEIKRNLDLDLSSMQWQDFQKEFQKIKFDDFGLGPTGARKVFDDVTRAYEGFLQKPGIGRFRTRFAGLEGFQFTENWMKVAGYNEMKRRLVRQAGGGVEALTGPQMSRIEKEAAEFARTIVFDYSELPPALDFLKRTGLVLFPGFTYFLAGRTVDAALRRPGSLAVADRISEAVTNASLDIEQQILMMTGLPDWMRGDQGVPMPFTMREGPQGEQKVSVIPMNQLIPTSTIWDGPSGAGNPWAESIAGLGVAGPLFEVLFALVSGDGEAPLTARFGNRVFDPDARGGKIGTDVFRFLYNTLAPSNIKKLITVDMEGQLRGLIPSTPDFFRDMASWGSAEEMEAAYSFEEHRTRRPDKGWREAVISTFLRSPQVVALDGPISGIRREFGLEQTALGEEITMLRRRANRARSEGNERVFEIHASDIRRRQAEFQEKWNPFIDFMRRYEERRRLEREQAQ